MSMHGDFPPRGPRFSNFPGPGPGGFMGTGGHNPAPGLLGPPPMFQGPGQQFDPSFGPPTQSPMGPQPLMNLPREMGPMQKMVGPTQGFIGGPPGSGMPPGPPELPIIDPSKEVWVETTSDHGKVYYYHATTRQSIWKKPMDENVQIITQNEANALAAATAAGVIPPINMGGNMANKGLGQGNFGDGMRDNQLYHQSEQGPRNKDDSENMEENFLSRKDDDIKPNGAEGVIMDQEPPQQEPPSLLGPRMGGPTAMPLLRPVMMGPVGMPGFPRMPFGGPGMMPFMGGPMMMPGTGTVWRAHQAPDGRTYYYNITTMETQWNKPKELEEFEEANKAAEEAQPENISRNDQIANTEKHIRINESDSLKRHTSASSFLSDEEKAKQRQRPVATEPVPGTPWCVVWTGDDKVFFYNPTTKLSMWERPEELRGRSDIDKILADPPHLRKRPAEPEPAKPSEAVEAEEITEDDANIPAKKKKKKSPTDEGHTPNKLSIPYVPLDERIQHFKDMLHERQVSAFSTWDKELHKIVFDPRYTMLNTKERRQVFDDYVKTRAEEERKEKKAHLLKVKEEFRQLLGEVSKFPNKMTFSEFAGKFGKEPRFKAVDKMKERENLFNEFLQDAKKKKNMEAKEKVEKIKTDFMALLEEKKTQKYSRWSRVYEKIHSDPRYSAVESSSAREEMWKEYCEHSKKTAKSDDEDEETEKKRRTEESMKARTEQVEKEKAERSREIDSERQKHKQEEANQHFKALLSDLVRSTDQSWSETRRQLRKEPRWAMASLLTKEEKERYFDEHIDALNKRKRSSFRKLLEETSQIELTSTWKEVKKMIKEDPRYSKFSSSDRKREREFDEVMKDKKSAAKAEFRDLLKETKIFTHKSKEITKNNPQHMKEIVAVLENDKRYLVMDCMPRERDDLIYFYMDDLHRKGPPPPPTATEPSRRGAK